MAKIIGQVESLKTLKDELKKRNITRFNSIGDINKFSKEYKEEKQKVIEFHEISVTEEILQKSKDLKDTKVKLELAKTDEITKLNTRIENFRDRKKILEAKRKQSWFLGKVFLYFKVKKIDKKISYLTENYDLIINDSIRHIKKEVYSGSENLTYLTENRNKVINDRSQPEISKIDRTKNVIEDLRPLIAGAIGESLVEKEIGKLSDDYTLINDFSLKFTPPIYNRKTDDRIYSIQLDHLLVSRSGLFILETKNWSKASIKSLDLRSPVEQIIRTSYAMYIVANNQLRLDRHHWGTKKIPIRNIIVMIHAKPNEEFKFVKVKLLKELNSYIEFFEPVLSRKEVERVANKLINENN